MAIDTRSNLEVVRHAEAAMERAHEQLLNRIQAAQEAEQVLRQEVVIAREGMGREYTARHEAERSLGHARDVMYHATMALRSRHPDRIVRAMRALAELVPMAKEWVERGLDARPVEDVPEQAEVPEPAAGGPGDPAMGPTGRRLPDLPVSVLQGLAPEQGQVVRSLLSMRPEPYVLMRKPELQHLADAVQSLIDRLERHESKAVYGSAVVLTGSQPMAVEVGDRFQQERTMDWYRVVSVRPLVAEKEGER